MVRHDRAGAGRSHDNIGANYLVTGTTPRRAGNRLATVYPSDRFRCLDGDVMLIVGNDEQFRRFCLAMDVAPLADDARFSRNEARLRNARCLDPWSRGHLPA